jgi:hypothetical protein
MDLIDEAINKGYIEAPNNNIHYNTIRSLYENWFSVWLSETKVDLIGSKDNFESLINMDNFLCFLKEQSVEISNSLIKSQKEKAEDMKVEINEKEVEIAFYIVGLKGHFNHLDTTIPVFHYIDTVLQKYNISYREAYRILYKYRGAYNQKYYDNVVTKVLTYLNDLSSFSLPKPTDSKTKKEAPKAFDELFYDANFVLPCIEILKEVEPPLIDTECNYIGKSKGAFCVWIDEMQKQGIIKHYSDRKIFALLLPQIIKRFSIDESMFGKPQNKAENQYRFDIKTKLSQVKLSQNSQKGKLGK